jgi:DNA replication protein DnaC
MLIQPTIDKLHSLRLTGMLKALQQQMNDPDINSLSFDDRFGLMVDTEMTERDNRKLNSRLKAAKLKEQACIENVDLRHSRGLDKTTFKQLSLGLWINQHRNLFIDGPTGIGKTYLLCSLLHSACRNGFTALYTKTQRLLQDLAIARADGSYNKLITRLAKTNLLALDDFGLVPITDDSSRDLLEVIDDRCKSGSTIISSQLPWEHWHQTITNPTIADAIIDRVIHNAYKIKLNGKTKRKDILSDTEFDTTV